MGYTRYVDIYDPEMIMKLIGQKWQYDAKVVQFGSVRVDSLPLQGTQLTEIRQTRFQGRSGQALNAGDPISAVGHVQTTSKHPILWRYDRSLEPDVTTEIEEKNVPKINADLSTDIQNAASQYVDDSFVSTIKGTGAALSDNQYGTGSTTISLDELAIAQGKLGDQANKLAGGIVFGNSAVYTKLYRLGLVAATSNTFGNAAQDQMVKAGMLPSQVLGMTYVMNDKFAAVSANKYYLYMIAPQSMVMRGSGSPLIEAHRVIDTPATSTYFSVKFSAGFDGVSWGGTASEKVSDSDLETSGNWTLSASYSKYIKLVRFYTTTA